MTFRRFYIENLKINIKKMCDRIIDQTYEKNFKQFLIKRSPELLNVFLMYGDATPFEYCIKIFHPLPAFLTTNFQNRIIFKIDALLI